METAPNNANPASFDSDPCVESSACRLKISASFYSIYSIYSMPLFAAGHIRPSRRLIYGILGIEEIVSVVSFIRMSGTFQDFWSASTLNARLKISLALTTTGPPSLGLRNS